jgi:hypothetical protein
MTADIIAKKVLDINKKEPPSKVEYKDEDGNELENLSHTKKQNIGKKM